jgi:hypothetical protein
MSLVTKSLEARIAWLERERQTMREEISLLRRNWVDRIEKREYVMQVASRLWGAFDAEDKAQEIVSMFELFLGQQAATGRVMQAIQRLGWDVDGTETAWDFLDRIRLRSQATATMVAANAIVAGLNEKEKEILRKRFEKIPEAIDTLVAVVKSNWDLVFKDRAAPPDAGSDDEEEDK